MKEGVRILRRDPKITAQPLRLSDGRRDHVVLCASVGAAVVGCILVRWINGQRSGAVFHWVDSWTEVLFAVVFCLIVGGIVGLTGLATGARARICQGGIAAAVPCLVYAQSTIAVQWWVGLFLGVTIYGFTLALGAAARRALSAK
jgi:hypothetical protein